MTITTEKSIDQIAVNENGLVMLREKTVVLDNGKEIATTFHRSILEPEDDLTGQPSNVVAIAQASWTPEIIAAYKISKQEVISNRGIQ